MKIAVIVALLVLIAISPSLIHNSYGIFSVNLDEIKTENLEQQKFIETESTTIETDSEKTKENITRYFQHVLDDSYSDDFIDIISEYAVDKIPYKFFKENNENPLLYVSKINDVYLPDRKGLETVFSVDRSKTVWMTVNGIEYEKNDFDSFKRITPIVVEKECSEKWQVMTRVHCDFDNMKEKEENKAILHLSEHHPQLFIANFAEINNTFAYDFPVTDSRTQFLIIKGLYDWARLDGEYDGDGGFKN